MSDVGIFVHEHYAFTDFSEAVNARAVGNDGAEGVHITKDPVLHGTINWFTDDKRLHSQNGNRELWRRIHARFEAWNPEKDLGRYGCGKVPKQITNVYGPMAGRVQNPFLRK